MKPQDILFFIVLIVLIYKHNSKWAVSAGIFCLLFAIPLFAFRVFFTAERLTWYAGGVFLLGIILEWYRMKTE